MMIFYQLLWIIYNNQSNSKLLVFDMNYTYYAEHV